MGHRPEAKVSFVLRQHNASIWPGKALLVEHEGLELTSAGLNVGLYYRQDASGNWIKVDHPQECPCGNAEVHGRHISALRRIDSWLADPNFVLLS